MKDILWKYRYVLGAGGVVMLFFFGWWFTKEQPEQPVLFPEVPVEEKEIEVEKQEIVVDVKGAVATPGIYVLEVGERVYDAIQMAGGFLPDAEERHINLAMLLEDEMVIYVPVVGEEEIVEVLESALAEGRGTVNINRATAEELQSLSGIGPSKAAAIVQYREENGTFSDIEDLKNVAGIGEKTFETIKEQISVR